MRVVTLRATLCLAMLLFHTAGPPIVTPNVRPIKDDTVAEN